MTSRSRDRALALTSRACRPGPARLAGTTRRSGGCCATRPTPGRPPTARRTRPARPPSRRANPRQRGQRSAPCLARERRVRALEADPGPGARHRGAVRARAGSPAPQQRLSPAQHQATVAAAGDPRLPRVRLRATTAARLAARTGSCASTTAARAPTATAAPRDASATTGPSAWQRSTSSSGTAVLGLLEDPDADPRPRSTGGFRRCAPSTPPPRRRDALERDLTRAQNALRRLTRRLPRAAHHARRAPRPHARPAQARGHPASPARRARRRAARRRDLPQAHRDARRLPRPARHQRPRDLTVEQRQQIIRLVVREVLIGEDDVTIRHSIPVPTGDQPPGYLLRLGSREDPTASARPPPRDDPARAWTARAPRVRVPTRWNARLPRRVGRASRQPV